MPVAPPLLLYAIENVATGELLRWANGEVRFFHSKRKAKRVRDATAMNTRTQHQLVRGPDHKHTRRDWNEQRRED